MLNKYLKLKIFFLLLLLPHAVFSQSNDLYNQGDFNAAFRTAFKQSMAGEKEGDYVLGKIYFYGKGNVKKNFTKALKYLNKAIKNKSNRATLFLAKEYQNGKNIKKNFAEARRLFLIASKNGAGDFSKQIASLSQQLSDDQLTPTSCRDAKKAAEKNDRKNYLYYIRCMMQEEGVDKDIDKINRYVNKIKDNPKEEEIFLLAKVLINGPSGVKNPYLAYLTIENYLSKKNVDSLLKDKLLKQLSSIKFSIINCEQSLQSNTDDQIKFICSQVENNNNPKSLISLFEIYENNKNIFNNHKKNKIKILTNAISYNNAEALDKLEIFFNDQNESYKFLDFLSNNINNKGFSSSMRKTLNEKLIQTNIALMENFDQDNLNIIYTSISNNNCDLLDRFVDKARLKDVEELPNNIDSDTIICKNLSSLTLVKTIKEIKNLNIKSAFNNFSKLCDKGIKYSCYFYANMYLNDTLPKSQNFLNDEDKVDLAIRLLNQSVDNGNIDAYVPLAKLMLDKKIDEKKAISLLDTAISRNIVDALYVKAEHLIGKDFILFGSKKSCRPLRTFLNKNVTSSEYFSRAVKLYNKKCK